MTLAIRADIAGLDAEIRAGLALARRLASPIAWGCPMCRSTSKTCGWCEGRRLDYREAWRIHRVVTRTSATRVPRFPVPEVLTAAEIEELDLAEPHEPHEPQPAARSTSSCGAVLSPKRSTTMTTVRFLRPFTTRPHGALGPQKCYSRHSVHDVAPALANKLIRAGIAEPDDLRHPDGPRMVDIGRCREQLHRVVQLEREIVEQRVALELELATLERELAEACGGSSEPIASDGVESILRRFYDEACLDVSDAPVASWTPPSVLYEAFQAWCSAYRIEPPMDHREFLAALRDRYGASYRKSGVHRCSLALNLTDDTMEAAP